MTTAEEIKEIKTRLNQRQRDYIAALPPLRMSLHEFEQLSEYSATNPTGTTPGKMWRRHSGVHDEAFKRAGGVPMWIICQYDPDCPKDAKTIAILYFRPVIRVQAVSDRNWRLVTDLPYPDETGDAEFMFHDGTIVKGNVPWYLSAINLENGFPAQFHDFIQYRFVHA